MKVAQELQEAMENLRKVDIDALVRTEDLGRDYDFRKAVDYIKDILPDLEQVVQNASALRVSSGVTTRITSIAKSLLESVQKIQTFTLKGNEAQAAAQHKQIQHGLSKLRDEALDLLSPLIARIEISRLDPEEAHQRLESASAAASEIEQMRTRLRESEKQIEQLRSNAEAAIKEVRDAFGREGASISAKDFDVEATKHSKLATRWFWGSTASLLAAAALLVIMFRAWVPFGFLTLEGRGQDYLHLIHVTIFKIVMLSIAFLIVQQCLKNYKINAHLEVLNRHRQLSLSVYPLMANAARDAEQSNTIVKQAAKAIFEPGTTGYLNREDGNTPVNLTEIINKVSERVVP